MVPSRSCLSPIVAEFYVASSFLFLAPACHTLVDVAVPQSDPQPPETDSALTVLSPFFWSHPCPLVLAPCILCPSVTFAPLGMIQRSCPLLRPWMTEVTLILVQPHLETPLLWLCAIDDLPQGCRGWIDRWALSETVDWLLGPWTREFGHHSGEGRKGVTQSGTCSNTDTNVSRMNKEWGAAELCWWDYRKTWWFDAGGKRMDFICWERRMSCPFITLVTDLRTEMRNSGFGY